MPKPAFLGFFPYVPLRGSYDIGEWRLEPVDEYQGSWASTAFEDLSRTFLRSFRRVDGHRLDRVYVLAHRERGIDGQSPTREERESLQACVNLAVLDRAQPPNAENNGLFTATSDNCQLFLWELNFDGWVTLDRGSIVQVSTGGHKISDQLSVPAPLELHMPFPLSIDSELLSVTYDILIHASGSMVDDAADATRKGMARAIGLAIGWLSKAWRNSPSIGFDDRIVFLKTGFEALSGRSDSYECSMWLRRLYEQYVVLGSRQEYSSHLLWSPEDRPLKTHTFTKRGVQRSIEITNLQDWFINFSRVRNAIVHDGVAYDESYSGASEYSGSYLWVGERLLRESIKLSMARAGYPDMWRSDTWRRSRALLNRMQNGV